VRWPGCIIGRIIGCPELVVVPPGSFTMGWDGAEPVREGEIRRYEGPERMVTIAQAFGVGRYEVTTEQFSAFVEATGFETSQGCYTWDGWNAKFVQELNWRDPGYGRALLPNDSVACVDWNEAQAYVAWLSAKTGAAYRLLTEAQWEYAARAGIEGDYMWSDAARACDYANVFDASAQRRSPDAPTDGSPVITETCDRRGVKGGAWMTAVDRQRFTFRGRDPAELNSQVFGFRVARDL
jgi:formylglycine-generating enzyme required for sulfatase activity